MKNIILGCISIGLCAQGAYSEDLLLQKGTSAGDLNPYTIEDTKEYGTVSIGATAGSSTYGGSTLIVTGNGNVTATTLNMGTLNYGTYGLNVTNGGTIKVNTLNFNNLTGGSATISVSGNGSKLIVDKLIFAAGTGDKSKNINLLGGVTTIKSLEINSVTAIPVLTLNGADAVLNLGGGTMSGTGNLNMNLTAGILNLSSALSLNNLSVGTGLVINFTDASLASLITGDMQTVTLFNYKSMDGTSTTNLENAINQGLTSYSGSNYDLTNATVVIENGTVKINGIQAIPEPSTATFGLLGLGALMLRRRRRV